MSLDEQPFFNFNEAEKSLLSTAVACSPFPMMITDREGLILYVNLMFTLITGYAPDELKGQTPRLLKSNQTPPLLYKQLWNTILSGKLWSGEICNRKKSGEEFWESISIHNIKDTQGNITHFVSVWREITAQKKIYEGEHRDKEFFEKQSRTDDLTGLYNRRHIFVELEREIQRAIRYDRNLSGMMIDVDNFKQINDRYGHSLGDRVLCSFARILEKSIRSIDILGRYGGDEFLIILPETRLHEAKVIAERILKSLKDYRENVLPDFSDFAASIGLVALDESCRGNKALFFDKIDNVLLLAKRSGKNIIVVG